MKRLLVSLLVLALGVIGRAQESHPSTDPRSFDNRVASLKDVADDIKKLDEPLVRIFLRLRLATLIWQVQSSGFVISVDPMAMTTDALEDLRLNEKEMPSSYVGSFQSGLLALVRQHSDSKVIRTDGFINTGLEGMDNRLDVASSLLDRKDGITPAVEVARRALAKNNHDPAVIFFLLKLKEVNPAEFDSLLSFMVTLGEQNPQSLSIESLFWLRMVYLESEISPDLKGRFLGILIDTTRRGLGQLDGKQSQYAYRLMNEALPIVGTQFPWFYPAVRDLISDLTPRVPESLRTQLISAKGIAESADRISALTKEAEFAKDESVRGDLLHEAAQLALRQKQFYVATDLAAKLPTEGGYGELRDQFLEDVVIKAIEEREAPSIAEYPAARISSTLRRASVGQRIALYLLKKGDSIRFQEMMNESYRLVESSENSAAKAKGFLALATTLLKSDKLEALGAIQAAVRVINNIPAPKLEDKPGSDARKAYSASLIHIAWDLIPLLTSVAKVDEFGARYAAEVITCRDLKVAARLGVSMGLVQLSKEENQTNQSPRPEKGTPKKMPSPTRPANALVPFVEVPSKPKTAHRAT